MSKLATIVHLLNNGFTEEQVTAMMEAAFSMQQPAQAMMQQPAQAMMQQPAQDMMQQPTPAMMQQPAQAMMQQPTPAMMQQPTRAMMQQPAQAMQADPYAAMNTKLDNIMGAVRAGAVMASSQPKQETADDVLGMMYANIIPPEGGNN